MLRRNDELVAQLLPQSPIPALRAVEPQPHWLGGHGVAHDPEPRLTSVDIVSGDPRVPGGPCVRVETGEVEDDDTARVVGRCQVSVDGRALPMEVVVDVDGGTADYEFARGTWEGYAVRVQSNGVPLDGLRLTRAGDLTQYRRQAPRS